MHINSRCVWEFFLYIRGYNPQMINTDKFNNQIKETRKKNGKLKI